MKFYFSTLIVILLFCLPIHASADTGHIFGTVKDAQTGEAIANVELHTADVTTKSDASGCFILYTDQTDLIVKHPGYLPQKVSATNLV